MPSRGLCSRSWDATSHRGKSALLQRPQLPIAALGAWTVCSLKASLVTWPLWPCPCPAHQQEQGSRKRAGSGVKGTGRAWGPGPGIAHPAEQAGRHAFSGCEPRYRHRRTLAFQGKERPRNLFLSWEQERLFQLERDQLVQVTCTHHTPHVT